MLVIAIEQGLQQLQPKQTYLRGLLKQWEDGLRTVTNVTLKHLHLPYQEYQPCWPTHPNFNTVSSNFKKKTPTKPKQIKCLQL